MRKGKPPREERPEEAKAPRYRTLTVEQVLEARWLYAQGRVDFTSLAKKHGVSRWSLKQAALGETYRNLPMPPKG
jgi:hypothetical protein